MSVADEFDVYLFPHDFPVNLSNPDDLQALRRCFAGRELYLAVGSDVVANASSYRLPPSPGCVQEMNHIVFRRQSDADGQAIDADLSRIQGKVLELSLIHISSPPSAPSWSITAPDGAASPSPPPRWTPAAAT